MAAGERKEEEEEEEERRKTMKNGGGGQRQNETERKRERGEGPNFGTGPNGASVSPKKCGEKVPEIMRKTELKKNENLMNLWCKISQY